MIAYEVNWINKKLNFQCIFLQHYIKVVKSGVYAL